MNACPADHARVRALTNWAAAARADAAAFRESYAGKQATLEKLADL